MKYPVVMAFAAIGFMASPDNSFAQSGDALQRLEAKLDALAKENAALRERVKRIEAPRQAAAQAVTPAASASPSVVSSDARMANAAYMPVKGGPAYRAPCTQFGGWYGGGNVGWGYYDNTFSDRDKLGSFLDDGLPASVNTTKSGVNAGVQGGYNWQRGCTVFGVETDWSWTSLNASAFSADGDAVTQDALTVSNRLRWFGTARVRTGVVVDDLLLYVTGGLAFAEFDRTFTYFQDAPAATRVFSSDQTRLGWTAGVGAEWALAGNWSVKGEFLYMRFEKDTATATGNGAFGNAGQPYRFESQDSVWVSRIGLNYRWSDYGKGPVVAKY